MQMSRKKCSQPILAMIQELTNQMLRVTIKDGRTFDGIFKCVDPECNIVLASSVEYAAGIQC